MIIDREITKMPFVEVNWFFDYYNRAFHKIEKRIEPFVMAYVELWQFEKKGLNNLWNFL